MNNRVRIITLDNLSKQAGELMKSINSENIDLDFFTAIDGRAIFPKLLDNETLNQKQAFKYRLSTLNSAEIGAYLSHYRCIKEAYKNNINSLCILEDDVVVEPEFNSILNHLLSLPREYEFIKLMDLKRCKRKETKQLNEKYSIFRPIKGTLGAQGYVINQEGMKKIVESGMPICKPIDKLFDHFWEIDLKLFSIEPHLIWERESSSSIKKPDFKPKKSIPILLFWKIKKLTRSIRRRVYILKRAKHFYPNTKTLKKMGKTKRKG